MLILLCRVVLVGGFYHVTRRTVLQKNTPVIGIIMASEYDRNFSEQYSNVGNRTDLFVLWVDALFNTA
jgi:hypothetical protein